jgi:hypothetical protein
MPTTTRRRGLARGVLEASLLAVIIALVVAWWPTRPGSRGPADGDGGGSIGGPGSPVNISGDTSGAIAPGVMLPLDLSLDNTNDFDLSVDLLTVTVTEVDAPRATTDRPCSAADFEVRPLAEGVELTLGAGSAEDLSGMGVTRENWPAVGMIDGPLNQDGCQGATLTLSYEASGVEVQR